MSSRLHDNCSASEQFFLLAQERYRMRLRRAQGQEHPWTEDPVLGAFRFCNVFREHDRTTHWFRENIREPLRDDRRRSLWATVAFRWFNRIETGQRIREILLHEPWATKDIYWALKDTRPLVTGAYMIKSPAGKTKLIGILECLEQLAQVEESILACRRLESAHSALTRVPYLGGFMAYEVVTDLRHTCLLEDAPDKMTWCHLGPGAARGISWITGKEYNRNSQIDQDAMLRECIRLLETSLNNEELWPREWPRWEMREVEHWLCEFDKWKRGQGGQRLKRRYIP